MAIFVTHRRKPGRGNGVLGSAMVAKPQDIGGQVGDRVVGNARNGRPRTVKYARGR